MGLFGLSLVFSFFTAFHFDLVGDNVVEVFNPIIHAKDLLARKLATATDKDPYAIASVEWEEAYEDQQDYRACALNQPRDRPKHGCITDSDTKIPYCQIQNLRIDTTKISGPLGGEPLEKTMGRDEDVELPKYLVGAFSTPTQLDLAENMNRDYWFYLLEVFMAMDINKRQKCEHTLSGTSLIITRYEYVDMYHTLKDLWNAFLALPEGVTKVDRVIFLDSHARGYLDPVWNDLFGPTMHIKHIDEGTCLEQAIFVPPGYSSVLWPLGRLYNGNRCTAMANAFVDFVLQGYELQNIKKQEGNVLIFDQVRHLDHPRSIPEEQHDSSEFLDMQAKILDETEAINVQVVDLHKLSFKSQLKLVRQADIMMGYQQQGSYEGSQLAHVMFLQDGATFIELKNSGNQMQGIARWRPVIKYRSIYSSSTKIIDYEIVPNIKDVLTPGWDTDMRRYPDEYYEDEDSSYNETDSGLMDDVIDGEGFDEEEDPTSENLLTGWNAFPNVYDETENYRQCAMNGLSPRPTHGCVVDSDTSIPYCRVENLRIDSSKIDAPSGGEYVDTVIGRKEDVEFPKYQQGALTVAKTMDVSGDLDNSMYFYLDEVLSAISTVPAQTCAQTVSVPTLFITRYEYVSLFHTLADMWNAFLAIPEGNPRNVQVVFLDAHAEGFLDSVWKRVFGNYVHVKQLPEGGVCYKNAIFVPSGHSSALWPRDRQFTAKPCSSMTKAFVDHFVQAYGLGNEVVDQGRITIIDRVPFVSHPRRDPSLEAKPISNLAFLKERLLEMTNATTVEVVDLEQTPFLDQLRLIRRSHILMGHQEAGLSQLIFMQEGTHVFEFDSSQTMTGIAKWKTGLTHRNFDGAITGELKELEESFIDKELLPAVNYALNRQDELESADGKVAGI